MPNCLAIWNRFEKVFHWKMIMKVFPTHCATIAPGVFRARRCVMHKPINRRCP